MKWITATEIDNWTAKEPRRAQELLPQLVWKLILGSCTKIADHHFPYGKAIQYSGYDGFLDTDDDNPFVPRGKSVWEFGTDEDTKGKLNSDYEKRTENPGGINMAETSFCFVTTRIWKHRQGIVEATEEKNAEGKWKSVRIFDANSLEMWLESCPAVSAWIAQIMGKPFRDIFDLGLFWDNQSKSTNPSLTTEFFTHGRTAVSEQILRLIAAGSTQIIMVAESSKEAILTLAAELETAEETEYLGLKARCLVVVTREAYVEAAENCADAILIPAFCPECKFRPLSHTCTDF